MPQGENICGPLCGYKLDHLRRHAVWVEAPRWIVAPCCCPQPSCGAEQGKDCT